MEWKTIEDVNDMHSGINDEDNRNKYDNEANKVYRKEEMGGIYNNMHAMHVIKILFSIEIPNDIVIKIFFSIEIPNDMA